MGTVKGLNFLGYCSLPLACDGRLRDRQGSINKETRPDRLAVGALL